LLGIGGWLLIVVDFWLHFYAPYLGMVSKIKRKTLPAIAKIIGLDNEQLWNFKSGREGGVDQT
jgi:SRSO17 transposase